MATTASSCSRSRSTSQRLANGRRGSSTCRSSRSSSGLASYFEEAVGHARQKNTQERDKAVAHVIRSNAKLHGFAVEKVRPDDYVKLLRYGSLFCLLLSQE